MISTIAVELNSLPYCPLTILARFAIRCSVFLSHSMSQASIRTYTEKIHKALRLSLGNRTLGAEKILVALTIQQRAYAAMEYEIVWWNVDRVVWWNSV